MKEYIVEIPEVWFQRVRILAKDEAEARELVQNGNGEYLDNELVYSHTLDNDEIAWKVGE